MLSQGDEPSQAGLAPVTFVTQPVILTLPLAVPVLWIDALSWWMVVQVVISQGFVWSAIATRDLGRYFWEELGWFVIFPRTRSRARRSTSPATLRTEAGSSSS